MSYNIEVYNLDVLTNKFLLIEDFSGGNFRNLTYSYKRNRFGGCTFSINADFVKSIRNNLIPFRNHIAIRRGNKIVWAGPISNISANYANVKGNVSVTAYEQFSHLFTRYTNQITTYLETDAGQIAWDLIDLTQSRPNGALGIIEGSIEQTMLRDRGYEYGIIGELITNLTEVINGFDFNFTIVEDANKRLDKFAFNVYGSLGIEREDLPVLKLGDNIQSVSVDFIGDIYNHILTLGFGDGEDRMICEKGDDAYQKGFTRKERIVDRQEVSIIGTLEQHTEADLEFYKADRYDLVIELNPNIPPFFGEFNIGDVLNFDLRQGAGFFDQQGQVRVDEMGVQVDSVGAEYITIKGRQL